MACLRSSAGIAPMPIRVMCVSWWKVLFCRCDYGRELLLRRHVGDPECLHLQSVGQVSRGVDQTDHRERGERNDDGDQRACGDRVDQVHPIDPQMLVCRWPFLT